MNADDIVTRLTQVEARAKSNSHRLDMHANRMDSMEELVQSIGVMANEMQHMKNDVQDIKEEINKQREKPAARWESIVSTIINAVTLAIVAYLLSRLGL